MRNLLFLLFNIFTLATHAQTWTNYTVGNTSKNLLGGFIRGIANDKDSSVWFATSDGVSRYYKSAWKNYSLEDGLATNVVYAIAVDNKGTKWVSTDKGISSFDGSKWTNFSNPDSVIGLGNILKLAVDKFNNVWFTSYGGITKYDGKKWNRYELTGYNDGITCDKLGNVWFSSKVHGVIKFDGQDWIKYDSENSGLVSNEVYDIISDPSDTLWISTRYGISTLYGSKWTTIKKPSGNNEDGFYHTVFGKNGSVVFVHYDSISRYTGSGFVNIEHPENLLLGVGPVVSDLYGNIWFPKYTGAYKYDGSSWTYFNPGSRLSHNSVFSLGCDEKNQIWCGTGLNDIDKFDGTEWTTYNGDSGVKGEGFRSMAFEQNGVKWFGSDGRLSKFDGKKWTNYTKDDGLENDFIEAIVVDNQNIKWMGHRTHGVSSFDGTSFKSHYYSGTNADHPKNLLTAGEVYSLAVDAKNTIWAACSYRGLARFDGSIWSYIPKPLSSSLFLALAIDQAGDIWCGTSEGVYKYDGVEWTDYSQKDTSLIGQVNVIKIDQQGKVWCGYYKKGVKMFDGSKWTSYTTQNGLLQNDVGAIVIDKNGNKWFGTWSNGLSKLSDGAAGSFDIQAKTQRGMVFHDLNGNGKKDKEESTIAGQIIKIDNQFTTTQSNGIFYTYPSNGNHTFTYRPQPNWKLTTDSVLTITVTDVLIKDTLYFGAQALLNVHEVQTKITGTATRSGFSSTTWLHYHNLGTLAENGTIAYTMDHDVNLLHTFPEADSIIGKRLVWKFTHLIPNQQGQIKVISQMPGVASLGTTLISLSKIKSVWAEDSDTLKQVLTGSYDPNDKLVAQGIGNQGYVLFGKELEYTVRFQNTGTDTAFNVSIRDTLDLHLDIASLRILASSHPLELELRGENQAIFHFKDLLLPYQKIDELGSNGFVKYAIKPKKSLAEHTHVKNIAHIYFDFNPAIVTNETVNTYVSVLPSIVTGMEENLVSNTVTLFPNPAKDEFTLVVPQAGAYDVSLSDIQGKQVKTWYSINEQRHTFPLEGLEQGMYIYTIKGSNGQKYLGKVVIRR